MLSQLPTNLLHLQQDDHILFISFNNSIIDFITDALPDVTRTVASILGRADSTNPIKQSSGSNAVNNQCE